ncbi:hypothetical protein STENM327S_03857 [Streptomyces tendae]
MWVSPSRIGRPARPARPPEISIAVSTMRLGSTPLAAAADSEAPEARRSKPKRVRLRTTQ